MLRVVQVVGAPSLCVQVRVGGMLANLPTCRLFDLPTFRLVGLLAGSGGGGEVVLRGFGGGSIASECWRVLAGGLVSVPGCLFLYIWWVGWFLVFWESNLAIRHCGNFKFSYSDFPHSLNEGGQSTPCG